MTTASVLLAANLSVTGASAEYADYGQIELNGLARENDWPYNVQGVTNAMVCNVNGRDGFLTVRSGPNSNTSAARKLNRLAIVQVDTSQRSGNWVRVVGAHRTFTPKGTSQGYEDLPVTGWAHDGYLCSFTDYPADDAFAPPPSTTGNVPLPPPTTRSEQVQVAQSSPRGKRARCEWDNGNGGTTETYACEFISIDSNGSFSVVRDDTYELMLTVERPGVGTVQEYGDGRMLGYYGTFYRSDADRACWISESREEKLCAY